MLISYCLHCFGCGWRESDSFGQEECHYGWVAMTALNWLVLMDTELPTENAFVARSACEFKTTFNECTINHCESFSIFHLSNLLISPLAFLGYFIQVYSMNISMCSAFLQLSFFMPIFQLNFLFTLVYF